MSAALNVAAAFVQRCVLQVGLWCGQQSSHHRLHSMLQECVPIACCAFAGFFSLYVTNYFSSCTVFTFQLAATFDGRQTLGDFSECFALMKARGLV